MLKPESLRKALADAVPVLKTNPEMLRLFVDSGNLVATLAASPRSPPRCRSKSVTPLMWW